MTRCIRVTTYESTTYENRKARVDAYHVYLDVNEVEMIKVEVKGPETFRVFMKSGQELHVSEDGFNRIEKAMRERV